MVETKGKNRVSAKLLLSDFTPCLILPDFTLYEISPFGTPRPIPWIRLGPFSHETAQNASHLRLENALEQIQQVLKHEF